MIILITGVSGAGKTALAETIVKQLNNSIHIGGKFFKEAVEEYDKKQDTYVVNEKKYDKLLQKFAENYKYTISESVFAGTLRGKLCIVLRCEIKELEKRLKKKKYSIEKIHDNIESELSNVCGQEAFDKGYLPGKTLFEFDTSELNKIELAEKVLELIKK